MNKTITINFYLDLDIGNGHGGFESEETGKIRPWNIGLNSKATTRQTIEEYCKQNSYTFKISNIKSRSLYGKEAQLKLEKISMKNELSLLLAHSTKELYSIAETAYNEMTAEFAKFKGRCDATEFLANWDYISTETVGDLFELVRSEYTDKNNARIEAYSADCYVTFNGGLKPLFTGINNEFEENLETLALFNNFLINDRFNIIELKNHIINNDRNFDDRDVMSDYIHTAIAYVNGSIEDLLLWKGNCDGFESLKWNEKCLKFANKVLTRLHLILIEVKEK